LRDGGPLKITMVTPYDFWPVRHGGAVRMYNVVRELARRGHAVTVAGFVDTDEQLAAARQLEPFFTEVRMIKRRCTVPDLKDRHALAKSGLQERASEYARYLKMFRYELEALRRFDVVFAVTPRDAKILSGYLNGAVRVSDAAPTGVDVSSLRKIQRAPDAASLLFVGYLSHTPNVDAILCFAREILPRIHQRVPEATLTIAGANPPDGVRALAADPRITVAGFVPDLAPRSEE